MEITKEAFEQLKNKVKNEYNKLPGVFCPYFKEKVYFSSEAFQHLLYKGSPKLKERDRTSQYMRLKLFHLVPKLLSLTKTLQEYHHENHFVAVKYNKRREKVLKEVQYWGFIAIIENRKIKVIVKQTGHGLKQFWSIIPNWSTRKSQEKINFVNYSGDLEND